MKKSFKSGEIFIWFTGLGLGVSLIMISGLLVLIFINGSDYFLPASVINVTKTDGTVLLGQITRTEEVSKYDLPEELKDETYKRIQLKTGNREIQGFDFIWVDERDIRETKYPEDAVVIERLEFGNFYGFIKEIKVNGKVKPDSDATFSSILTGYLNKTSNIRKEINAVEKSEIGNLNYQIEQLRLKIKKIEYKYRGREEQAASEIRLLEQQITEFDEAYKTLRHKVDSLSSIGKKFTVVCTTASGIEKEIPLMSIVRVYSPNEMTFFSQIGFIAAKLWEFVFEEPRESNTEGGVFPAIFGTVMMVLLMSIAVVPFGVLTALYLREYAKQGAMVRTVRIAVNNLAGVPSIVFGVFGLGFFIYFVGGTIDQLFFPERLPSPTWGTGGILWASLTLALLTMPVVIVATEEALAAIPRGIRESSLALGATKWQTIRRIVLPAATPGILTGLILAMARGAGEVAPLMITGVVKLAPSLPLDSNFPFFHLDRKFMHLGFHIYDVGFQSPNVEAATPMVYMTTLLLIFLVVLLNITAMVIRARLRKKYKSSTF
jgi:phosphate transport system permease protein